MSRVWTASVRSAVFLDLNGTLVEPVVVDRPDDFMAIAGVARAVASLNQAGFICPVVTVQSRIEKGVFTAEDFRAWFQGFAKELEDAGAHLSGVYVCPHRFSTPCACAKPGILLYQQAAADLRLALSRSFTIGDTLADVEAARRFGGLGCLVRTGYATRGPISERALRLAATIGDDLEQVAEWIIERAR